MVSANIILISYCVLGLITTTFFEQKLYQHKKKEVRKVKHEQERLKARVRYLEMGAQEELTPK